MIAFLNKLERAAGRFVNAMDGELNQPISKVLTFEVFTHGESPNGHIDEEQPVIQIVQVPTASITTATYEPGKGYGDAVCTHALCDANI